MLLYNQRKEFVGIDEDGKGNIASLDGVVAWHVVAVRGVWDKEA